MVRSRCCSCPRRARQMALCMSCDLGLSQVRKTRVAAHAAWPCARSSWTVSMSAAPAASRRPLPAPCRPAARCLTHLRRSERDGILERALAVLRREMWDLPVTISHRVSGGSISSQSTSGASGSHGTTQIIRGGLVPAVAMRSRILAGSAPARPRRSARRVARGR